MHTLREAEAEMATCESIHVEYSHILEISGERQIYILSISRGVSNMKLVAVNKRWRHIMLWFSVLISCVLVFYQACCYNVFDLSVLGLLEVMEFNGRQMYFETRE